MHFKKKVNSQRENPGKNPELLSHIPEELYAMKKNINKKSSLS